jgi:hypothetical protein
LRNGGLEGTVDGYLVGGHGDRDFSVFWIIG